MHIDLSKNFIVLLNLLAADDKNMAKWLKEIKDLLVEIKKILWLQSFIAAH